MQKNGLIGKTRLISKFKTSQTEKQIIAKDILPNISKIRGNLAVKLDQLIKYSMRKIFREKSYLKCGQETIPRLFSKKSNLNRSLDQ